MVIAAVYCVDVDPVDAPAAVGHVRAKAAVVAVVALVVHECERSGLVGALRIMRRHSVSPRWMRRHARIWSAAADNCDPGVSEVRNAPSWSMAASQMRCSEGIFLHIGVASGIAEHPDQRVQYGLLLTTGI